MGLIQTLRNYENDPMWADHCEMPKRVAKAAADQIEFLLERIRVEQEIQTNICKERDHWFALLPSGVAAQNPYRRERKKQ